MILVVFPITAIKEAWFYAGITDNLRAFPLSGTDILPEAKLNRIMNKNCTSTIPGWRAVLLYLS